MIAQAIMGTRGMEKLAMESSSDEERIGRHIVEVE